MFEEVMKNQWRRIFTRLKWEQKETNGDIDVLVVCSPQNFRDALYNIKRKFHKVQVTYHNQKL